MRKLRDMEAKAGHEIVMERQKEIDDEEQLNSAVVQEGSYPPEIVPRVSSVSYHANISYPSRQTTRAMVFIPRFCAKSPAHRVSPLAKALESWTGHTKVEGQLIGRGHFGKSLKWEIWSCFATTNRFQPTL